MRKVLRNHDEVAHFWANRRQPEGRASRVYFAGDTIYSYGDHFPMARLYRNEAGETVAAFTSRTYSVSTAKHMGLARRAASHHKRIEVIDPTATAVGQLLKTQREIIELLDKASRAGVNRTYLLGRAARVTEDFNTYAELRGEVARIDASGIPAIKAEIEAAEIEHNRRMAEAAAKQEADNAEAIEAWLKGAAFWPYTAEPRLRLKVGLPPFMVETSFGAEIPVADAERLWPVIQRVMSGDKDYDVGMELGGYRLTKIRRDGSIVVGCHDIAYSEIERIAQQLGLMEAAAA